MIPGRPPNHGRDCGGGGRITAVIAGRSPKHGRGWGRGGPRPRSGPAFSPSGVLPVLVHAGGLCDPPPLPGRLDHSTPAVPFGCGGAAACEAAVRPTSLQDRLAAAMPAGASNDSPRTPPGSRGQKRPLSQQGSSPVARQAASAASPQAGAAAAEAAAGADGARAAKVTTLTALEGGFLKSPEVLRTVCCEGRHFVTLNKTCRTLRRFVSPLPSSRALWASGASVLDEMASLAWEERERYLRPAPEEARPAAAGEADPLACLDALLPPAVRKNGGRKKHRASALQTLPRMVPVALPRGAGPPWRFRALTPATKPSTTTSPATMEATTANFQQLWELLQPENGWPARDRAREARAPRRRRAALDLAESPGPRRTRTVAAVAGLVTPAKLPCTASLRWGRRKLHCVYFGKRSEASTAAADQFAAAAEPAASAAVRRRRQAMAATRHAEKQAQGERAALRATPPAVADPVPDNTLEEELFGSPGRGVP